MHPLRTALRRRRYSVGAAMVEAVIVLPLFVLLFGSVLYVRDQVLAQQQAKAEARTCAWLYSANGCTEVPQGCESVLSPPTNANSKNQDVEDALRTGTDQALADASGPVAAAVTPLVEPAIEAAFGRSVVATASRELERPGVAGGGTKKVQGRYELACNLNPTTAGEVAKDAWNLFGF